jgi:hypothetical protein
MPLLAAPRSPCEGDRLICVDVKVDERYYSLLIFGPVGQSITLIKGKIPLYVRVPRL